jgi:excisionase family DNA binding protein
VDTNRDRDSEPLSDMVEEKVPVDLGPAELEERLERHARGRLIERDRHVDLSKEEYTPDEVAHLLGTSRDVVMHAIRGGELVAQRAGKDIVCITHADVVNWLRTRGPGV